MTSFGQQRPGKEKTAVVVNPQAGGRPRAQSRQSAAHMRVILPEQAKRFHGKAQAVFRQRPIPAVHQPRRKGRKGRVGRGPVHVDSARQIQAPQRFLRRREQQQTVPLLGPESRCTACAEQRGRVLASPRRIADQQRLFSVGQKADKAAPARRENRVSGL